MELPLQIAFHNVPQSPAIEARIRELATGLDSCFDHVISCRVVVDQPHRHHKDGNAFQVRIDVKVPGTELVVKHEPGDHADTGDLEMMVHEAFDEARRQLEDHVRRLRGQVKTHATQPHARVGRLFGEEGYGFLTTPDGREIYFHRNSVINGGFKKMEVGTEVSFVEEEGEKGPQASTVKLVGRHSHL